MARTTKIIVGKPQSTTKITTTGTYKNGGIMPGSARPGKKPTGNTGGSGNGSSSK
ncbi:MAG: hypothetical protein IKU38_08840 [Clostridia bacterium]|nr:hypothetical protein [Clostridia bacterium]